MRVLIIDDHPIALFGIRHLIEEAAIFTRIETAQSGSEAIFLGEQASEKGLKIDLVVCDTHLQDIGILKLISILRTHLQSVPIVLLSVSPPKIFFKRLIELGVKVLIIKSSSKEEILHGLKQGLQGIEYLSNDIKNDCLDHPNPELNAKLDSLRDEELEFLSLSLGGRSHAEMRKMRQWSQEKIHKLERNLVQKLKVENTLELFMWALREGLTYS